MKILTKAEQLKKEANEAWGSYQVLDTKSSKLRSKIFDYEHRFFNRSTKLRMMKFERDEIERMASQLASYSHMLNELYKIELDLTSDKKI